MGDYERHTRWIILQNGAEFVIALSLSCEILTNNLVGGSPESSYAKRKGMFVYIVNTSQVCENDIGDS